MADIGIKIKLDGESQFSKDIRTATSNVKGLNSEMTLAETQFKKTGNKEEYLRQKTKILNEQIANQEKAVEAAKAALEQCNKQGLDKSSQKTIQWRSKLAQAETKLISLQTELGKAKQGIVDTGGAFDDGKKSAGDFGDKLDSINRNISLQNVSDAVGAINSAIDAGIHKAVNFGKALWTMTSDSTKWADDLATMAEQTGIDTRTLQQWEYAARFIDTDVDTIIGARDKLMKRTGDDDLLEIGVDPAEAEDSYDLMWQTLEAIGKLEGEAQDNAAMAIFGKSFKELLPLIHAGREEWDSYADRAPVVSEEDLKKLTEANDALEDLDANFENTKRTLLAQLAPALTTIANSLTGALQELNKYLQTEEGQQKLQAFSDAVVRVADSLFDIDWSAAVDTAGKAFTAITDALTWIVENKNVVKAALMVIAGAKLWSIIATAGTNVGKLLSGLQGLLGLGGGAGATTAGATGTTAAAATGTGAAATGTGATVASTAGTTVTAESATIAGSGATTVTVGTTVVETGALTSAEIAGLQETVAANTMGIGSGSLFTMLAGGTAAVVTLAAITDALNGEDYQKTADVEATKFDETQAAILENAVAELLTIATGAGEDGLIDGEKLFGVFAEMAQAVEASGGSAEDFIKLFDYIDTAGEKKNFLTDLMEYDMVGGESGNVADMALDVIKQAFGQGELDLINLFDPDNPAMRTAWLNAVNQHANKAKQEDGSYSDRVGYNVGTGVLGVDAMLSYLWQFGSNSSGKWTANRNGEAGNQGKTPANYKWHGDQAQEVWVTTVRDETEGRDIVYYYDPDSGMFYDADWNELEDKSLPSGMKDSAKGLGTDYAAGIAEGIEEGTEDVATAAGKVGSAGLSALAETLDIHSPSEETRALGRFAVQGFILGMQDELGGISAAAGLIAGNAMGALGVSIRGSMGAMLGQFTPTTYGSGSGSGGRSGGISEARFAEMITDAIGRTRFEIDGKVAGRAVAPTVSQILARQMAERNPVY